MVDSDEFRVTVRRGARAAGRTIVAHVQLGPFEGPTHVGFVVSKAVGNSVVRNRVKRKLRHVARGRVDGLPRGTRLVVRALPASATASSDELAADLMSALDRATAGHR